MWRFGQNTVLLLSLTLLLLITRTSAFAQKWRWQEDQCIRCDGINELAWSPDSKLLAVAASDGLSIYDVSGQIMARLTDGESALNVTWSHDGSLLASYQGQTRESIKGYLRIFDVQKRRLLRQLPTNVVSVSFSWSPHENILAYGNDVLNLWDAQTDKITVAAVPEFPSLPIGTESYGHIQNVSWSPADNYIAISTTDQRVLLWNIKTQKIDMSHDIYVSFFDHMVWRPDGQKLIIAEKIGAAVELIDAQQHTMARLEFKSLPTLAVWDPTGRFVAVAPLGHFIDAPPQIVNSETWQPVQYLDWPNGWVVVNALAWSPDGIRIAIGMDDGTVHTWMPLAQ